MSLSSKSKWFIVLSIGFGLVLGVFFLHGTKRIRIEQGEYFKQSQHPPDIKQSIQNISPVDEPTIKLKFIDRSNLVSDPKIFSKIDHRKLPPELRPVYENLIELQNNKIWPKKNELAEYMQQADALIKKADQVVLEKGIGNTIHDFQEKLKISEIGEDDLLENRLNELKKRLKKVREKSFLE